MERFERIDKLGEGGQGKVYKVRKKDTGEVVVLKMINCSDPTFATLAEREIEVMKACIHPHIIRFEESFRHNGKSGNWFCLVMEYCAGGDLFSKFKAAVQEKQRFEEAKLTSWICQIASGLQYMHEKDLWHRDIKAANILFDADGVLKLGDFGLSSSYSPEGHKTVVGTPFYFAPEIMLNQQYSNKVDIWNLGVVMLELMTFKQLPVNVEVLRNDKMQQKLMQSIMKEGYSKKIALLVASMLSRSPDDRPSAREILQQVTHENDGVVGLPGREFGASEALLRETLAAHPLFAKSAKKAMEQKVREQPPPQQASNDSHNHSNSHGQNQGSGHAPLQNFNQATTTTRPASGGYTGFTGNGMNVPPVTGNVGKPAPRSRTPPNVGNDRFRQGERKRMTIGDGELQRLVGDEERAAQNANSGVKALATQFDRMAVGGAANQGYHHHHHQHQHHHPQHQQHQHPPHHPPHHHQHHQPPQMQRSPPAMNPWGQPARSPNPASPTSPRAPVHAASPLYRSPVGTTPGGSGGGSGTTAHSGVKSPSPIASPRHQQGHPPPAPPPRTTRAAGLGGWPHHPRSPVANEASGGSGGSAGWDAVNAHGTLHGIDHAAQPHHWSPSPIKNTRPAAVHRPAPRGLGETDLLHVQHQLQQYQQQMAGHRPAG